MNFRLLNFRLSSAAFDALDNPYWSCLATRHAHVARGGALARRYPPDISPIAAVSGDAPANVAALEALVELGDDMGTLGPYTPKLGRNWQTVHEAEVTQMLRTDRTPLPESECEVVELGPDDVAEMLALVELTQPGPFRRRTIELGRFIGIRENGRLVAMAGERGWTGDCREVSGVCTHPDAQGRGHARALIARVVNRMLRAGEVPFLHAETGNARAIALYESLGFVERTRFPLLAAKRVE
ncbi:MAG TPA: GNAT family N-acetyltransferase [Casimicrobiaceae bacterium]|nr:GNAT family N-acetyltransferase [Casimicrobiaceae bacterium]